MVLEPLRRSLPDVSDKPEIDEDGEEFFPGFNGDVSQSSMYVTDGHVLLLKSAVDPAIVINRDPDNYVVRYATETAIQEVWNLPKERTEVTADFIGGCDGSFDEIAFVRDALGRVMVLSGHKLAFALRAVQPDKLTVSTKFIDRRFNDPLAFWRDGKLVGLLMPMRISAAEEFAKYDMQGEPVDLMALVR